MGASPATSAQFRKLVEKHVQNVTKATDEGFQSYKDRLFKVMSSNGPYEDFYSISGIGDIPSFNGVVTDLSFADGYYTKIEPKEFAGRIKFERKLLDDEAYGVLSDRSSWLAESSKRTQVKAEMKPFAYAFSNAFEFMTSEEGVALCSNSHSTKSGTSTSTGFDNLGTSSLSKTSVAATRLAMRQFRDPISERIDMGDSFTLIVPDTLEEAAFEIVQTPKSLDTAEGNANFQYKKYDLLVLPRLDDYDTNNWFMVEPKRMKKNLIWVDRVKADPATSWDLETYTLSLQIYFRFAYGWIDWRWVFGNQVS